VVVTSLFSPNFGGGQNVASLSLFYFEEIGREMSLLRRKTEGFLWLITNVNMHPVRKEQILVGEASLVVGEICKVRPYTTFVAKC